MCWLQLFTKYNYKLTKLLWTLVIYYKTKGLKLKTAQALFTPLRFCWYLFLWHLSYLFALRCFTKAKRKISGFVLSYLFAWLQNCRERDIRFCAFTFLRICQTHCLVLQCFLKSFFLWVHIQWRFNNLLFCAVSVPFYADQCEHFHNNGGFSLRFCLNRSSVNSASVHTWGNKRRRRPIKNTKTYVSPFQARPVRLEREFFIRNMMKTLQQDQQNQC